MASEVLTIIVTGANRGIGFALVQLFASNPPKTPAVIYACARQTSSIPKVSSTESATVRPTSLDVSDSSSIKALAEDIRTAHPGGVDIIINNAGVNYTGDHSIDNAKRCIAVNVDGMLEMTRTLGPLMRRPGKSQLYGQSRIVNLSSAACSLRPGPFGTYSRELLKRIQHAKTMTDVMSLRNDYVHAVSTDTDNEDAAGWPKHNSYKVSKALVNVLTRVAASDSEVMGDAGGQVAINCCCPGWVNTDMGGMMGPAPKTPEEGARVPFELATRDLNGVTGEYWALPSVSEKSVHRLAVMDWMGS